MVYIHICACATLLLAGISDFKTREVSDSYSYIILVLSLVKAVFFEADVIDMLLGGIVVFLPYMIVAIKTGGIGGADIKLSAAVGLLVGFNNIIPIVILSYSLLFAFAGVYRAVAKKPFMQIPYICFLAVALYGFFIFKIIF